MSTAEIETLLAEDTAGDEDQGADTSGAGEPVIAYNILFDHEGQPDKFFEFLKWLKREIPEADTIGERLELYINNEVLRDE